MSNFDQPVFTLPKAQGVIHLALRSSWDKLRSNQRTITMVQAREIGRLIGVRGNPEFMDVSPESETAYALVLSYAQTSAEHVDKFAAMAAAVKANKANAKFIEQLKKDLGL